MLICVVFLFGLGGILIKTKLRENEAIKVKEVRLIDEAGNQLGIVKIQDALKRAREVGLDLIEISPNAQPPVCRIMDLGKFQYEQKKKAAKARKNQQQIQVKEIKLRPVTDEGDYQVKLRNLIRFLEHGDKAKVTLRFKGRELMHHELGLALMERLIADLADYGIPENKPKFEGRQLIVMFSSKKKK